MSKFGLFLAYYVKVCIADIEDSTSQGNNPYSGMDNHEILHIALAPPVRVYVDLIKGVVAIISKDLNATQILLAEKITRIIAHYQTVQAAAEDFMRLPHLLLNKATLKEYAIIAMRF